MRYIHDALHGGEIMKNTSALFLAIVAGLFWGTWPLVMKQCGAIPPITRVFIMSFASGLLCVPFMKNQANIALLLSITGGFALLAGVLNIAGHIIFQPLVAGLGEAEVSIVMPIAGVVAISTTALGGILFYGESLSPKKAVGLIGAAVVVWLISSK